jgi:riboflavin kinase/FMN adenylyltransferase
MKVTPLPEVVRRPRRVAVGMFDGVHLGHREVIGDSDTVLTFDPHPSVVLRPDVAPQLLTSLDVKIDRIAGLGIEELVIIPFDKAFSQRSPEDFIENVLIGQLDAKRVSVGQNFRFGHRAKGTPEMLLAQDAFETRVVPMVARHGESVSSSRIRELVRSGDVELAGALLGGPFELRGTVVHGDKRGRELGFPTANVVPDPAIVLPSHGVYAGWANGHPAAINVGTRPTFDGDDTALIEPYLLDFDGDLYGQTLAVQFVRRLRDELAFDSVHALIDQMRHDVDETRRMLGRG